MKFYEVKIGENNNREWRAILTGKENNKYGVVKSINANASFELEQPLGMHLINVHLPQDRKEKNPFNLDLIYWTDDLTLDAFKPRGASCVIVSQKFKDLLFKYNFHRHEFYPINLFSIDESDCKKYYLMHIFDKRLDYVNYLESYFLLKERATGKIVNRIQGTNGINDFESYAKKKSEYLRNENLSLDFDKMVLTVDYDVLWNIPNRLLVNDKVKMDILNSEINGIELSFVSDPEFILKSEFHG